LKHARSGADGILKRPASGRVSVKKGNNGPDPTKKSQDALNRNL